MLACLPGPGDLPFQLLSHTQMNTGLQKWDTTQKMRSAQHPTPAELDAYAEKVANNPLTIKIFPNSVKVPQRKHIRRTVNGLDTSGQRYSPYPLQSSTKAGLLAIVKSPAKGIVKDFEGARTRILPEVMMNPPSTPYVAPSTLNHPQALSRPRALQHAQALQNMQQQQSLSHTQSLSQQLQHTQSLPPTLQRTQSIAQLPATMQHPQNIPQAQMLQQSQNVLHNQSVVQTLQHPQRLAQPQTLQHPPGIPQTLQHAQNLAQPQTLQHPASMQHPGSLTQPLQHPQRMPQTQSAQHPPGMAHQTLQHPATSMLQPGLHGSRKMPDADAPPNVTVSTSTIPLSMAATLQQNRPPDLTSIVHQISQFCQARAGISTTSVCEGQIANPSPISRNLLINASTRVSAHSVPMPSCGGNPGLDHAAAISSASSNAPMINIRVPVSYPNDMKPLAWNQQQLAHLQQMCSEVPGPVVLAGKHPPRELAAQGFPGKVTPYAHELCTGQAFNLKPPVEKPTPSPPVNGLPGPMPYTNGQYFQPLWNNILPTPNSDSSGSQDLAMPFHGGQPSGAPMDCAAGAHYRAGAGVVSAGQSSAIQSMDYLSGDFQQSCFRDQTLASMGKIHRPPMSQASEPTDSRSLHIQHPGYR
ncbi:protein FAM222B [Microcaecilia unicolor]|uniref:Protein FAM222B n=1 Tax=Microcaecilia unicolor TaxID=1415580 RepID=A0A6P7ZXB0_9AMPH|nr:protein FAM222B [Microcaecilia unicolor]XP_030078465.1 protein FAM222B [Microcaecilia unicolor]